MLHYMYFQSLMYDRCEHIARTAGDGDRRSTKRRRGSETRPMFGGPAS
jgi:hypothetical protein